MTDRDLQQKRLIAAGIDVAVLFGIGVVFSLLRLALGLFGHHMGGAMIYLPRVIMFVATLLCLGFVLVRDVVANGSSIGKKLQGLRVVTTIGTPINLMESVKRNAVFGIAGLFALISATLQLVPCLGDLLACLLTPFVLLAILAGLAVAVVEIVKILQDANGVRLGDQFAETRVVR